MNEQPSPRDTDDRSDTAPTEWSWERWGRLIGYWLPYLTLAIALGLSWLQPDQSWPERGETAGLALLAAIWVTVLYTRAAGDRRAQPARMLLYFAGFLGLAAALMLRQPIFFLFAVTGFFHASDLRPWPLVFLGVGLTSTLMNTLLTGFPWPQRESWLFFGSLIALQTLVIGFGNLLAERLGRLSEERRETISRLEVALAENAGLQAQLVSQAREAGVLEERQRLAREIHDTLAQGLIGIITQLGAAQQAEADPARRQQHLARALLLARENLSEARRSVDALRPGPLVASRLPAALGQVARDWSAAHGVRAELVTTGEPIDLPPEVETALLRTAQEALANVARHASAARAGLTLSFLGNVVVLDIRDDGAGFDPAALGANGNRGFGLASMRQRMHDVAGSLEIESEPGEGTVISARVPIHRLPAGRKAP
jgi:signal transduction histidine kinase